MKTENLFNFEFIDGAISMHVRATKYTSPHRTTYRVSYHNSMRDEPYTVKGSEYEHEVMAIATAKRAECYADMAGFLQQVM
jgi:hypothetical protein